MPLGQRRRKAASAKRACSNCEAPSHRRLPDPALRRPPWPHLPHVQRLTPASRAILRTRVGRVTLQRMDNVGIVVESLDAAISFFAELGLELEGRAMVEGEWAGRV